jgi:hypothetical protein
MAGSKRWYRYVGDNGDNYAVELDNTNTTAVLSVSGTVVGALGAPVSGGETLLPGRLKMRYVNTYLSTNPLIRRKLWVPLLSVFNQITNGSTIAAVASGSEVASTWVVTSKRGERSPIANITDTGQVGP